MFSSIALACIEHEQRSSTLTSCLLNLLHERSPDASTALALEDKELLHFGPMLRILLRGKRKLNRANDMTGITRHQKYTHVLRNFLEDSIPILTGILSTQGREKADRGAACYRVLKQIDQFRENRLPLFGAHFFDNWQR